MEIIENIQATAGLIFLVTVVFAMTDTRPETTGRLEFWGGLTILISGTVTFTSTLILIWS